MRRRLLTSLALAASVAVAVVACADDDGDDDGSQAAGGGELFTLTTDAGTLEPVEGEDGVFTLTFDNPAPQVTTFTDRPVRNAGTEGLVQFVDQWDARGFAEDPPNAALVVDAEPDNADTAVFTLAEPTYDQASGAVTYRATQIEGGGTESLPKHEADLPSQFRHAHLFIDPAAGAPTHDFYLTAETIWDPQFSLELEFDSGFSVVLEEGIVFAYGVARGGPAPPPGDEGGGEVTTQQMTLTGVGSIDAQVSGPLPITGTATVPPDLDEVWVEVDSGPKQRLIGGPFCFPLGPGC
jgi:hypothetical protein